MTQSIPSGQKRKSVLDPIGAEEEICFSESEALEKADKMRQDVRFEDVTIEEEERDFFQSRKKSKSR